MKTFIVASAAVLAFSVAPLGIAAPVQWSSSVGGNNHYYDLVAPSGGITWTDANAAAAASSFEGIAGHLATVSDADEWNFIITEFPRDWTWIGLTDQGHEGTFTWVTGEPLTFTDWIPGEPNNAAPGGENWVFYQRATALGGAFGWNDYQDVNHILGAGLPLGYIVEFDTPEPSSFALASLAFVALGALRRRSSRMR